MLERAGIVFRLHEYDYDADVKQIGVQAAETLGVEPARLLKTLMARAGSDVVCALLPSDREMSLKRLAAAHGSKDAVMLTPTEAERISGYHVGGISPRGQKWCRAVFVEQSALAHPTVLLNGGRRGLQIEIAPHDLMQVLAARSASLAGDSNS